MFLDLRSPWCSYCRRDFNERSVFYDIDGYGIQKDRYRQDSRDQEDKQTEQSGHSENYCHQYNFFSYVQQGNNYS